METGSAGTQPCRGIVRWAHRDDEDGADRLAGSPRFAASDDSPHALENPGGLGAGPQIKESFPTEHFSNMKKPQVRSLGLKNRDVINPLSLGANQWQQVRREAYHNRHRYPSPFNRQSMKPCAPAWPTSASDSCSVC